MKQHLVRLGSALVLLIGLMGLNSCTEEGNGGGTLPPLEPLIQFLNESGALTDDAVVGPGEVFRVKLDIQKGDNPLKALSVRADNDLVATSRMEYNSGFTTVQNPFLVTGTDVDGFEIIIDIEAHDSGTRTYTFNIEDEVGETDEISLDITVATGDLSVELVNEAPYLLEDTELESQATFSVKLKATRGAEALETVAVYQDGNPVSTDRLEYEGSSFANNPRDLSSADRNGFESVISVFSHDSGSAQYTFEVADAGGNTESVSINIIIGGAIDTTYTMILLNNADGQNPGGLDLHVPEAVPRNSADAEIRDTGIDLDEPASDNWIQKVRPVNDAELVMVDTGSEFGFEEINSKATVKALFDEGTPVVTSDELVQGDALVVKKGNDYFLLFVTEVVVTADDNNDYYQFDIKQALDVE